MFVLVKKKLLPQCFLIVCIAKLAKPETPRSNAQDRHLHLIRYRGPAFLRREFVGFVCFSLNPCLKIRPKPQTPKLPEP